MERKADETKQWKMPLHILHLAVWTFIAMYIVHIPAHTWYYWYISMGTGAYSRQKRDTYVSFEMDDIQIEWYLVIKQTANTNVKPLGNSLESQKYICRDAMCRCIAISARLKLSKKKLFANRACKRPADRPIDRPTNQPTSQRIYIIVLAQSVIKCTLHLIRTISFPSFPLPHLLSSINLSLQICTVCVLKCECVVFHCTIANWVSPIYFKGIEFKYFVRWHFEWQHIKAVLSIKHIKR